MDYSKDRQLTFPQRNWFLLCILVAILSPLVVHWVQAAAHKQSYQQSMEIKPVNEGGSAPAGTTAAGGQDSTYKMSSPPQDSSKPKDSSKK